MLTDYSVTCPHENCGWHGWLLPEGDLSAFRSAIPTVQTVTFECPECHEHWHAEVVGDDVRPLALEAEPVATET